MRLVSTRRNKEGRFTIHQFKDEDIPRYAILSHTWDGEEVTFQDMHDANVVHKKGYKKIQGCCSVARAQGLSYVWMDTCCIDKTSSTELSEAINSMYRWYRNASVCYAYLADVETPSEIAGSRWFERGFTLQELIAPSIVVFYNQTWDKLGSKATLQDMISKRTRIPIHILADADRMDDASVAQRMSWAADRKTSRLEDEAYSLMGLFGINMPLLYGEGKAAFIRLQEEIIKMSDDHSIFAWRAKDPGHGGLLAPSVDAFSDAGDIVLTQDSLVMSKTPWTMTNKGIHLDLPFLGIGDGGLGLGILPCTRLDDRNRVFAIYLRDQSLTMERFERVRYHRLELLDLTSFVPLQFPSRNICIQQRRLAVTNRRTNHSAIRYLAKNPNANNARPENLPDYCLEWFDQWLLTAADECGIRPSTPTKPLDIHLQALNLAYHTTTEETMKVTQSLLSRRESNINLQDQHGRTLLSHVAEKGHIDIVSLLLLARQRVKVNLKDRSGRTPLSYAIEGGHAHVVWLLLTHGDILVDYRDNSGFTPLLYAAKRGNPEIIHMLLGQNIKQDSMRDGAGRTVICHASEAGNVVAVRAFLTRTNLGPNVEDAAKNTPLIYAAANGHETVVRLLLAYGAEVHTSDKKGFDRSATWLAALYGHEDIVRLLLPHVIGSLERRDNEQRTMLHWSVINRHLSIAKLLLDHGANIEAMDSLGRTPICLAAECGDEPITKLLLSRGAIIASVGRHGLNVLHQAIEKGHGPVVKLLLAHGGNTKPERSPGTAALWLAVCNRDHVIIPMLLTYGADIEGKDEQRTLLHKAAIAGHETALWSLLYYGADMEATDKHDMTPLWYAFLNGNRYNTSFLLIEGANIEHRDKKGRTLLQLAVVGGREQVVNHLLAQGADLEARDRDNLTPLWHAVMSQQDVIACLLISKGANIGQCDDQGRTPLHWAVINKCRLVVAKLLASKASLESEDDEGRTPLHWAAMTGNLTITMSLLEAGANVKAEDSYRKMPIRYAKDSGDKAATAILLKYS